VGGGEPGRRVPPGRSRWIMAGVCRTYRGASLPARSHKSSAAKLSAGPFPATRRSFAKSDEHLRDTGRTASRSGPLARRRLTRAIPCELPACSVFGYRQAKKQRQRTHDRRPSKHAAPRFSTPRIPGRDRISSMGSAHCTHAEVE
jgi:hypothetical protein